MYQIPFATLVGKIYGEKERVLLLDLQAFSGLKGMDREFASMGLEDLLSVAITGNYSKGRILECIRHEQNFDYVCAISNNQCLAEGNGTLYLSLIDVLVKEFGYQRVIINFGSIFIGQIEMMESCKDFYLLEAKELAGEWREEVFFQELKRQEKTAFLQAIHRVDIPVVSGKETDWFSLVEKWNWGYIGELLRHRMEKERHYGAAM